MSIIGETIAVVTSVSQSVTVVTSIQNSGVSFSLTFSQEMRSKSVVGTISPSIAVGKTSMGIITSIIGGVVTSVAQSVTVVTSIQNSWVSLSLGFSFSLTFSQEMRSKSVVGTIGPSVTVGKTSMGIVGETGIAIVTSVTSIV